MLINNIIHIDQFTWSSFSPEVQAVLRKSGVKVYSQEEWKEMGRLIKEAAQRIKDNGNNQVRQS